MATFEQVVQDIQKEQFQPVYFLQGEEPFFIDNILAHLENKVVPEEQKSFNQYVLYGKDTSFELVLSAARTFPMMGERQLVLVREAQEMKGWQRENDQKLLLQYLENPAPSTVLAFGYKYKTLDKRTKIGKSIDQLATVVNGKRIYENKIPAWIKSYVKAKGQVITDQASVLLAENIGNNLQRLSNEIDKVLMNLGDSDQVNEGHIHRYVGISKEYNTFELQKAIGMRQSARALKIVRFFAENPKNNPLVLVLYSLHTYFSKLMTIHTSGAKSKDSVAKVLGVNPSFAGEYLTACRNYNLSIVLRNLDFIYQADLQSKGIGSVNMKEKEVLTELIYKLMN